MNNQSGRGRGCQGRGRQGRGYNRGRGRGKSTTTTSASTTTKERELKFSPDQHAKSDNFATHYSTCESTTKTMQKTFKGGPDIAQSSKDVEIIDLLNPKPDRAMSVKTDAIKKA